jgi:hypothetical protein
MATPPKVDLATMSLGRVVARGESQASDRRHVLACVVATVPGTPGDRVSLAAAVVAALLPPSL